MTKSGMELPLVEDGWIGVEADWSLRENVPWMHLVSLSAKELATHGLVIGATGSGKTVLLLHLIALDLLHGRSVCLLDLRGDLVGAVLELCARLSRPSLVKIIDLREKQRPIGFNPLAGSGEPYFRSLAVLDAVAAEAQSWGVQLAETLRNALMLLAEAGGSLTDLEALLYERATRHRLLSQPVSEPVRAFWQRYDDMTSERQATLAMPVLNKLSLLLATPTLRRILGHPKPLDLGRHLDTPGSVLLVSLAVDELHGSAKMMGSLVLSATCREIFARVHVPESKRNPVRLYVDEFEHFGMQDFETILAEGRRFKFSLVLAHQTLAQLTPRMRSMILGNVGVKVVFRCGREDTAVLSRDLFGSPTLYDFSDLPVGYAVLWKRTEGAVEVEVNEPILRDVGLQSDRVRVLLDTVYGPAPQDRPERHEWTARTNLDTQSAAQDSLEDLLCG